jgi:hypothetical protein
VVSASRRVPRRVASPSAQPSAARAPSESSTPTTTLPPGRPAMSVDPVVALVMDYPSRSHLGPNGPLRTHGGGRLPHPPRSDVPNRRDVRR